MRSVSRNRHQSNLTMVWEESSFCLPSIQRYCSLCLRAEYRQKEHFPPPNRRQHKLCNILDSHHLLLLLLGYSCCSGTLSLANVVGACEPPGFLVIMPLVLLAHNHVCHIVHHLLRSHQRLRLRHLLGCHYRHILNLWHVIHGQNAHISLILNQIDSRGFLMAWSAVILTIVHK